MAAPPKANCARRAQRHDLRAHGDRFIAHRAPLRAVRRDAGPHLARVEIGDQRREAAAVVLVRVGERHDVDGAEAAIPQVGRHHVFADIELRARDAPEGGDAAAIQQHAFAIGKQHQQAVALAHVDGGQFQFAGMNVGRERVPHQQHEQRRHRERPPARAPDGGGDQRRRKRDAEPYGRRGNPPVRFQVGVEPDHFLREPQRAARRSWRSSAIR